MYFKSVKTQTKSLSLTLYNNITLINEIRAIPPKDDLTIEYLDISNFIDENSILVEGLNISSLVLNYVRDETCKDNCNPNLIPYSITIKSKKPISKYIQLYYLSRNIQWTTNYFITLDKETLILNSWFNITNISGLDYINSNLKLISGYINLSSSPVFYNSLLKSDNLQSTVNSSLPIDDNQIYLIDNTYNILNNSTTKIKNFTSKNIKYEKFYDFGYYNTIADIVIKFFNSTENNLGIPLSSGTMNFYRYFNENLEFLGGSSINNIGINREVSATIGKAFNVTVERIILSNTKYEDYSYKEVKYIIQNTSNEDVNILIGEPIFTPWVIEASTDPYSTDANGNPNFSATVPEQSTKTITFSYKYNF